MTENTSQMAQEFQDLRPNGGFRVILADPATQFKVRSKKGLGRSAERHYPTMKMSEIMAMPVADLAADDAHLFLWSTTPMLEKSFGIMKAWGFKYSAVAFTWVKLNPKERDALFLTNGSFHLGMGYTTRKNTEVCLLGRRGKPTRNSKSVRELMIAARREHSRKPEQTYERIEEYSDGPYVELFARQQRQGWSAWGNQTDKFTPSERT